MSHSLYPSGTHFASLLEHLGAFDAAQLQRLAELYEAESAAATDIARRWCAAPEAVLSVIDREIDDPAAWEVIEHLAQEHDVPIDVGWVDRGIRQQLCDIGLMKPRGDAAGERDVDWVPGAMAAILAPRLSGVRPTLPVLLGRRSIEEVTAVAREYGISTSGSKIEVVLRVSETFAEPGFIKIVLAKLPNPDWIGGAMMTLELGGICYWREIFGHEMEGASGEDKVVPLMRSDERAEQRQNAELLTELGVVYKVDDEHAELPLVAVPEELWMGLWQLGQGWLLDWTALAFDDLEDVAVRQVRQPQGWDVQTVLRWLVCEARAGRLQAQKGAPTETTLERLDGLAGGLEIDWDAVFALAFDLEVLVARRKRIDANPDSFELLDLPRQVFAREVLGTWCLGIVGSGCDGALPQAVGLDEEWRVHLLELFSIHGEGIAPWMEHEGIEHMETGAGCLREIQAGDDELMLLELGLTNSLLCLSKMHWLDLLSLLDADEWYSVSQLCELLQLVGSYGVFSQLGHIVQDPQSNYYFPVQRPSFFTLPNHTDAFGAWLRDIITGLLEPIGAAQLSEDGERVWLDPRLLRVPTPPDWPADPREHLVREVLGDPEFDFALPEGNGASLRPVPELDDEDVVSADLPIEALLEATSGRDVEGFDGKSLHLA